MRLILAAALALAPGAVLAHDGHGAPGPLHGLAHPFLSFENVAAGGVLLLLVAGGALLVWRALRKGRPGA